MNTSNTASVVCIYVPLIVKENDCGSSVRWRRAF
jgi:hypothetical protein